MTTNEMLDVWAVAECNCECNVILIPKAREGEFIEWKKEQYSMIPGLSIRTDGKTFVNGCEIIFAEVDEIKAGYIQ